MVFISSFILATLGAVLIGTGLGAMLVSIVPVGTKGSTRSVITKEVISDLDSFLRKIGLLTVSFGVVVSIMAYKLI